MSEQTDLGNCRAHGSDNDDVVVILDKDLALAHTSDLREFVRDGSHCEDAERGQKVCGEWLM